ncbi:TetR/AcrR family transcriptional regulator [Nocardia brasiliensis]|uniref:TetR/AcrR family transcriptional regulator n=1 Tax=Nocardia brasiliensis TaxID=37326 RepID=UPI001893045F|nr:TetR/AcrR family transcriptional regulator [Nocardia brasiliensis]MBF6126213.1 TetR/AcrR family transcriptional regulator [Nocardia brasiliensis]MBF6542778.1 TetR/AcrR family transcriptional regulator [Nocardia brasiliensis]
MTGSAEISRPRRTQQERRAATVTKLVDATIAAISEVGYQRTTVQEVCGRAGLSVGAMFRQFDGRLDLIVRTAEEIVTRQRVAFLVMMEHLDDQANPLATALRFLRAAQSSEITHALREIYLAARSDAELRARIAPTVETYYDEIVAAVERTGVLRRYPKRVREPLFYLALHVFSGQAVVRGVYPKPEVDDAVLALLEDMLQMYADSVEPGES